LVIYIRANIPKIIPFIKSNKTMVFFLLNQSPKTPAIGDNNNLGNMDTDNIDANIVAEPVISSTYKDRANCCILLPTKETNLPNINKEKSFCFISLKFIC